jgi:ectoine hydroxylase-related dioxygenase (phytanoyl-CoA dioxygenase family)
MGINYCVDISDNKCVTSWYDDETFANRQISNFPKSNLIPDGVAPVKNSREIADYDRELEKDITKPVKSMIAKQGEVVLFNTDIWHDVDNTTSSNERTMLTLRSALFERLNFNQARQLLFGY